MALVHFLYQLWNLLGRVLKVRVKRDYFVASCVFKACHNRHVLTEVSTKVNYAHFGIFFVKFIENAQSCVLAAVIYENYLKLSFKPGHNGI